MENLWYHVINRIKYLVFNNKREGERVAAAKNPFFSSFSCNIDALITNRRQGQLISSPKTNREADIYICIYK